MQNTVTPTDVLECVISGDFHDPFSVLGMHRENGKLFVRTLLPGAVSVSVVDAHSGKELVRMERFADTALFDAEIPGRKEPFPRRNACGIHRRDHCTRWNGGTIPSRGAVLHQ